MNETLHQNQPNSQNDINANIVKNLLLNTVKVQPQGVSPMEQLQLKYNKQDIKDLNQLRTILSKILAYPSSSIAQLHMNANKLGDMDLKQFEIGQEKQNFKQISQSAKFCPCCGFIQQQNTLGILTYIKDINHMGISTFLYFNTLKNIIFLSLIMLFVFSIYALASNFVASKDYSDSINDPNDITPDLNSYEGFLSLSLGSKQINSTQIDRTSFMIQCWLGVAMISLWGIMFGFIKKKERAICVQVDIDSKTASDFTILVENFPSNTSKEEFETMLKQYQELLGQIFLLQAKTPIKIKKINMAKPFYLNQESFDDERLISLNQEYQKYRKTFIEWIKQRVNLQKFSVPQTEREKIYKDFEQIKRKRMQIYVQITNQIKKEKSQQQFQQTVPTFVTFQSSYNKEFLQYMHQDTHKVFSCLPCFDKSKYLYFKSKEGQTGTLARIKQAPQPQDIIWTNLGQPSKIYIKKKFITFGVSFIVLGASFASIYGLSKVQFDYAKTHDQASNQYISILISLCISIINIIIQQILRLLTKLQRSPTNTQYQTSLGLKAVVALLINSILIPILVNYFFKSNLYGVNGLAYDVFYLAITNSFLSPLLKIIDIYYYFTRFLKRFKNKPHRKLQLNQNQLNTIFQYMEFQIGNQYIYMVNLFLFTCFFCSLQPIIVVFSISGLFLMYRAQKYSLLNRCKRPAPGNNSINTAMYQMIYLGPAFYTIGSFCWSNFFKQSFIGIAPNLTAAIISGIIFIFPYKKIVKQFFDVEPEPQLNYDNDRIFMPSQYDRLNPSTSAEGIQDYMDYLADYKRKIQIKQYNNPEQVRYVEDIFLKQLGLGGRPQYQTIAPTFNNLFSVNNNNNYDDNQIILQQLLGTNKNIFNPALIGNAVLNQNHSLKMPTQNWFTNEEVVTYLINDKQDNLNNQNISINLFMGHSLGQQVSYQQSPEINRDGSMNFLNQAVTGLSKNNTFSNNPKTIGQIPWNIPSNIFGCLVKPIQDNIQNKNQSNGANFPNNFFNLQNSYHNDMNGKFLNPYSINLDSNAIINLGLKKDEDTINNVK